MRDSAQKLKKPGYGYVKPADINANFVWIHVCHYIWGSIDFYYEFAPHPEVLVVLQKTTWYNEPINHTRAGLQMRKFFTGLKILLGKKYILQALVSFIVTCIVLIVIPDSMFVKWTLANLIFMIFIFTVVFYLVKLVLYIVSKRKKPR
jgi:hypothetical protein